MAKQQKQQQEATKKKEQTRSNANAALKYSGMAFTMAGSIALGVFLGRWLDDYFQMDKSIFTAVFALLFLFAGFYVALKDILFPKK